MIPHIPKFGKLQNIKTIFPIFFTIQETLISKLNNTHGTKLYTSYCPIQLTDVK